MDSSIDNIPDTTGTTAPIANATQKYIYDYEHRLGTNNNTKKAVHKKQYNTLVSNENFKVSPIENLEIW